MEILKDAITPFYERVKRPFIGAYWMAAVAYNWKVWVALLFYKETVNGVDKITFIYNHINWQTLFLCPILIASGFLVFGSLLDLAAHYLQLCFKKHKRQQQFKIDGTSMIPGETFNRVIIERDEALAKFKKSEEGASELAKEINRYKEMELAFTKTTLIPDIGYFQGQWIAKSPEIKGLIFNFKKQELELIFPYDYVEFKETLHFLPILRSGNNLILPIRNENSEIIQSELNNCVGNGIFDSQAINKMSVLFDTNTLYWHINILDTRKSEFRAWANGVGDSVIFQRKHPWDIKNKLWSNDKNDIWPLDH